MQQEIEKLNNQQQQHAEQLQQSTHFSSLDDGLSTHLTQLQRFIQHYQNFEQQFGNVHSATLALAEKQQQLATLQQQFGHHEQISIQLNDQRQSREQKLQQLHALGLIQNQVKQLRHVRLEQEKNPSHCA